MNANPFAHLYRRCNTGSAAVKHALMRDGPSIIDIEPVGLCNFKCVMCPTGLKALGRPGGFMTEPTHQAILDKTEAFHTAIRYIGWGEPLMHPNINVLIAAATDSKRLTHLNTNGSLLLTHKGLAQRIVDAGLSSIKFSFQGVDRESYHAMRRTDFFEGLLEAIALVKQARGAWHTPFIAASTTTTTETPEQVEEFRKRIEPLVDDLTIGKTIFEFIDMAAVPPKRRAELEKAAKDETVIKLHPVPCPEIYEKLTIHWNGSARVCCNDYSGRTYLGNINSTPFNEMWRHEEIEAYRENVARGSYEGPLCSVCFDYHSLTKGSQDEFPRLVAESA